MAQSLIYVALLLSPLALGACSDNQSGRDGNSVVGGRVVGAEEEGADSSGSIFYIPDDKIDAVAENAKKGDNEALMKIINHYRFSYVGDDKDALSEKWEKIGADRAMTEPLRSPQEISKALLDNNLPIEEVNKMNLGRDLRGVAASYFRILLEKRADCAILNEYADKAKKANPDRDKEIDVELQSACKT